MPKATEASVQKAILEYLQVRGYFCWRNNTGGFTNKKGHFYRFGNIGSGDILGILPTGQMFSIEVKAPCNKPTEAQLEFMNKIRDNKGIAFVAYSVSDVINFGL